MTAAVPTDVPSLADAVQALRAVLGYTNGDVVHHRATPAAVVADTVDALAAHPALQPDAPDGHLAAAALRFVAAWRAAQAGASHEAGIAARARRAEALASLYTHHELAAPRA